jgi:hypothetical protein
MACSIKCLGMAVALAWAISAPAQGDTFKCTDANGRSTYTNMKEETKDKNCTVVMREISVVPAVPAAAPAARTAAARPTPEGFPKVDAATQKNRDVGRRKILEDELANEQKSLQQAKTELAEQQQTRAGDEKNSQRGLDRLQKYKDQVEQHEKNLEALKKELANFR